MKIKYKVILDYFFTKRPSKPNKTKSVSNKPRLNIHNFKNKKSHKIIYIN